MPVGLNPADGLLEVSGVTLGTAAAGLRRGGADDVLVARCAPGTRFAGAFTRNAFCAAPVTVCRELLASGAPIGGFVVNAGNANAGTGADGLRTARDTAQHGRELLDAAGPLLPFSTGVIGKALNPVQLQRGMADAAKACRPDGWDAAARAIMTTDTLPKGGSRTVATASGTFRVTGIAKGAGMICPDMATMLAFIA